MSQIKIRKYRKLGPDKLILLLIGITIPLISFVMFWLIPKLNLFLQAFQTIDYTTGTYVFTLSNFETFFLAFKNQQSSIVESLTNTLISFSWDTFVKTPLCFLFAF